MLTNTQLLLIASVLLENAKSHKQIEGSKPPLSGLALVQSLTKAASYKGEIVPDIVAPNASLKSPISLIGALSLKMSDKEINTWKDQVVDEVSFERLFDAFIGMKSTVSEVDATAGSKIIDALPPMVKGMIGKFNDVMEEFEAQHAPNDTESVIPISPNDVKVLPIGPESRVLNGSLLGLK